MKILSAEHVATCVKAQDLPAPDLPEVAFLGRSNVGKSSLINRLVKRKRLAQTSSTPGKTRKIHFYRIELESRALLFVDLPGYGYARVSKREQRSWKAMVEGYLEGRAALRGALLLQDLRRDLRDDETLLLEWLAERHTPAALALTKVDKLGTSKRAQRVRALAAQHELAGEDVIATSAQSGAGIDALWRWVRSRL